MKKQVFHLPQDSISDIIGCVNEKNEQILTKEEILRKEQLLEETYLRLAKGMNDPALTPPVTVKKRFGDVNLEISARGEAANPLIVACNVCSSLLLARKEGMLDEGVYRRK